MSPDEKAEISRRAEAAGLYDSAYMRVAGLNPVMRQLTDPEIAAKLVKAGEEVNRQGSLIKLWLDEQKYGITPTVTDVAAVLAKASAAQAEIRVLLHEFGEQMEIRKRKYRAAGGR